MVVPTYLLSKDPISVEQAEVVTLLAGIEVEKELAEEISRVVQAGKTGMVPGQEMAQETTLVQGLTAEQAGEERNCQMQEAEQGIEK